MGNDRRNGKVARDGITIRSKVNGLRHRDAGDGALMLLFGSHESDAWVDVANVVAAGSVRLRANTARQVISTVSAKVFFKGGRPRCSGRFLANLDILRLTTRGLTRLRRGSVLWAISSSSN